MSTRSSPRLRSKRLFNQKNDDGNDGEIENVAAANDQIPNGSKVRKRFRVGSKYKWFDGKVSSYDEENGVYQVVYEDDDTEECTYDDLLTILVSKAPRNKTLSTSTIKRKSTKRAVSFSSDGDEEYNAESGEDNDDDSSLEDYDDDGPTKKPSAKRAGRSKKAASVVTPSPIRVNTKQKSKSKGSYSPKVIFDSTKKKDVINPRSVAVRGLPRGALAKCPETGLTIRSADGILPIRNSSSSSILHSTTQRTKNTTTTADSIPTPNTRLPGRIIVVSADQKGKCPIDFVGKTFGSVDDFYAAVSNPTLSSTINYGMEVIADPVFAPWDFVHARLESSGLLENNNNNDQGPLLFVVQVGWDGNAKVSGSISWYKAYAEPEGLKDQNNVVQWAVIEAAQRDHPSVLIGVPQSLLDHTIMTSSNDNRIPEQTQEIDVDNWAGNDEDLLPLPSEKVGRVQLAASLMQKAIRRGKALCSTAPLLEACTTLLKPEDAPPGSTLAMLKTLWECMLVDASPFDDADDCLGLRSLLLLSLVAKANPWWTMPTALRRAAVACAIRTAVSAPAQPWVGFADRIANWWELEEYQMVTAETSDQKACTLRNILRAAQAVIGGRLAWGKWNNFVGDASAAAVISYINHDAWDGSYLPTAPSPLAEEIAALPAWEDEATTASLPLPLEPRFHRLDTECRLSAIEPTILPSTLVLLQALLSRPPTKWQKHSLPSLSKQVRKLISEANARYRERVQLARLSTWGKEKAGSTPMSSVPGRSAMNDEHTEKNISPATYNSFRDVVTSSGVLSEQETELVACFEAIQNWMHDRLHQNSNGHDEHNEHTSRSHVVTPTPVKSASDEETSTQYIQVEAGEPLSAFDGRVGFLLAFAASIEVEVCPDPKSPSSKEVVSAMFCGDALEPLLVQRIGKARREGKEVATAGGTTSGATAVPSLGYVQKERSLEEAMLFEATEKAVADHWKGGKILSLPLPPAGLQWNLPDDVEASDLGWEAKESAVKRAAELVEDASGKKEWHFTIAGKQVDAFDARAVMSPCALDISDTSHQHVSLEPGSERERLLQIALYVDEDDTMDGGLVYGEPVLKAIGRLHTLAKTYRETTRAGLSEGLVYDWMPLACSSLLPSRTWRDVLLAIRTREKNHVILGKGIRSDGSGTPLDLSEGVLVRIFHGLECLYPQAIHKDSALKFRVRPRGAAYYHMLASLERLGRGEGLLSRSKTASPPSESASSSKRVVEKKTNKAGGKRQRHGKSQDEDEEQTPNKRPRRNAAVAASKDQQSVTSKAKSRKLDNSNTRRSRRIRKSAVRVNMVAQDDDSELEDEGDRKPPTRKNKRTRRGQSSDVDEQDYLQGESSEDEVLEFNSVEEEEAQPHDDSEEHGEREFLPIPKIKTILWSHQEASVSKVVEGIVTGKRGHADASAVGAGKTLTALATIVRLAQWIEDSGKSRHGVLVMLPTKALIREWLIEIATHTEGFHLIEQREDGSLFSLTYGKTHPPIDANSLVISTLDRVCNHPFVRQVATFEFRKNYFPGLLPENACGHTMGTNTGEIASLAIVPDTKQVQYAHQAEQCTLRPNWKPKVHTTDNCPTGIVLWKTLLRGIHCQLGLFHFTYRITKTLNKECKSWKDAVATLQTCLYFFEAKDLENVKHCIRAGVLGKVNGKPCAEDKIELKAKTYRENVRIWTYDDETTILRLAGWLILYKEEFDDYGERLFTDATSKTVHEQMKKSNWVVDKLSKDELYLEVAPTARSQTGLKRYIGARGTESKLEKGHHAIAHFANGGMRHTLADFLGMGGIAAYNLRIRYRLRLAKMMPVDRARIPVGFQKAPAFTNHLQLSHINKLGRKAGLTEDAHTHVEILQPDNNERFFFEYFIQQQERDKAGIQHDEATNRCMCRDCGRKNPYRKRSPQWVLQDDVHPSSPVLPAPITPPPLLPLAAALPGA